MKVYYKPIRHVDFEVNTLNSEATEYDTDKSDKALTLTFSVKYKNGLLQNEPIFSDVTLNKDHSIEIYVKQKIKILMVMMNFYMYIVKCFNLMWSNFYSIYMEDF